MNYVKQIFKNIEKLYSDNRAELIEEDGLRLSKSTPRDIISNILKFKTIYEERQLEEISKTTIASDIFEKDESNDVVRTNIRTMTELKLIQVKNDNTYIFTDEFKELENSVESIRSYLIEGIKMVSSLEDMNMIYNAILCILREGYLNGKILGFPDSKEKFFKAATSEERRVEYCTMVYDIYGFRGRGRDPKNPDYTPNSNYRFIGFMENKVELIQKVQTDSDIKEYVITEKGIDILKQIEFNLGNKHDSDRIQSSEMNTQKVKEIKYPHNRILFGAPGTGKSHTLKENSKESFKEGNVERVTFHPNYSYSQFVGTYKPKPVKVGGTDITYEYVPGPFLRQLVEAMKSINKSKNEGTVGENYLLIIEEINRANVASVFGDIFQLLDRDGGESEYSITTSEDMRAYLADKLCGNKEEYKSIKLPSNLYIWATMNSADQGVFPMDTAFKRRWSFEYIDIDAGQEKIEEIVVGLGKNKEKVKWNELRNKINDK
ncbi:MAG: McrB family protein, partial [Paraclostridium sp.]|uniref:McrB family protein n=1 Tax=Paraclostridium sp. TaxID=2023273 RepID=UPI003F33BFD7